MYRVVINLILPGEMSNISWNSMFSIDNSSLCNIIMIGEDSDKIEKLTHCH